MTGITDASKQGGHGRVVRLENVRDGEQVGTASPTGIVAGPTAHDGRNWSRADISVTDKAVLPEFVSPRAEGHVELAHVEREIAA